MLIKIFMNADEPQFEDFEFECSTLKEVLSAIKFHHGQDNFNYLLQKQFVFVLKNAKTYELLSPEELTKDLRGFSQIALAQTIDGKFDPASWGMIAAFIVEMTTLPTAIAAYMSAYAVQLAWISQILASLAVNALMSAFSPTPEYSGDPAKAKQAKSSLFGTSAVTREQGGVVPIIFGQPYCGGTLISSGISSKYSL